MTSAVRQCSTVAAMTPGAVSLQLHYDAVGQAMIHYSCGDLRRRSITAQPLPGMAVGHACYKTTSSPVVQNLHRSTTTSAVRRCSAVAVTPLGDFHCSSTMAPSAMRCSITAVATSDDVPLQLHRDTDGAASGRHRPLLALMYGSVCYGAVLSLLMLRGCERAAIWGYKLMASINHIGR